MKRTLVFFCGTWVDSKVVKSIYALSQSDLKSLYDKQILIDSGFEVFRL